MGFFGLWPRFFDEGLRARTLRNRVCGTGLDAIGHVEDVMGKQLKGGRKDYFKSGIGETRKVNKDPNVKRKSLSASVGLPLPDPTVGGNIVHHIDSVDIVGSTISPLHPRQVVWKT